MASINFNYLRKGSPEATKSNPVPKSDDVDKYMYKDVKLDIQLQQVEGNTPSNRTNQVDIADIRDILDIQQSLQNIFNTIPGQKILNPNLGMNLNKFVFDPINRPQADLLARSILEGLDRQEPRVKVVNLSVIGRPEQQEYEVNFTLALPGNLGDRKIVFDGLLNADGFKIHI